MSLNPLMLQCPNPKFVREWARRLGKDPSQIRRLIKSGRLENRYPRPNEGPPVPADLKGKIPVRRDYVEVDVGQRNRASKKSLAGRLEAVMGEAGSDREKLWRNVFAAFDARDVTQDEVEAFEEAFNVVHRAGSSPEKLNRLLNSGIERCRRRIQKQNRASRLGKRRKKPADTKKRYERLPRLFLTRRIHEMSERDVRYTKRLFQLINRLFAEQNAGREPDWTQDEIAYRMPMSKSGLRKFLKRTGLDNVFAEIRKERRKSLQEVHSKRDL